MAGGIDKYFQFARCFRDESLGSDRQPEFTQIDMEMAFIEPSDIKGITEKIVAEIWKVTTGEDVKPPFESMSYNTAMQTYGSDKPDLRFGLEITEFATDSPSHVVDALVIPNGSSLFQNGDVKGLKSSILTETFPLYGGKVHPSDIEFIRVAEKNLRKWSDVSILKGVDAEHIQFTLKPKSNDMIVVNRRKTGLWGGSTALGRTRLFIAAALRKKDALSISSQNKFLWVEDFPLFSPSAEDPCALESTHHPFTAPTRALHYDLVLNGQEIGGGSIRIHNPNFQRFVMEKILGLSSARVERDFGHLLKALQYGCPPHGGIALGLDRIMSIVCGTDSIRDVIAFPKLAGGDLFTNSPGKVPEATLSEYNIKIVE
ncbi:tRNA synthetases class II-domain-containing protein [Chytridium lagenaria]|nr:tRNA synthetases class II-domain-containing protein [Chytridium lagenaria]